MGHDFKKFPELRNSQLEFYYMDSPHKQILDDFNAVVVKVTDGDTVRVKADFRSFDFPIRMAAIQAPELNEEGGVESALWLKDRVLGQEVTINIDYNNRVGKFGRIIGDILMGGESMSEASLRDRQSRIFGELKERELPPVEAWL